MLGGLILQSFKRNQVQQLLQPALLATASLTASAQSSMLATAPPPSMNGTANGSTSADPAASKRVAINENLSPPIVCLINAS